MFEPEIWLDLQGPAHCFAKKPDPFYTPVTAGNVIRRVERSDAGNDTTPALQSMRGVPCH